MENLERGLKLAGQPVKRGSMAHDHDMYMLLTDNAAQLRDRELLREYAPRLEKLAARDDHKLYLAIAARAQGVAHRLAGEHKRAEARLTDALMLFMDLGTRWQIARTLMELGDLEAGRSKKAKAREYYAQAREHFEAMKAVPDIERAQEALGRTG